MPKLIKAYAFNEVDGPAGSTTTYVTRIGDDGSAQMTYAIGREPYYVTDSHNVLTIRPTGSVGYIEVSNSSGSDVAGNYYDNATGQNGLYVTNQGVTTEYPGSPFFASAISDTGYIALNTGSQSAVLTPQGQQIAVTAPTGATNFTMVGVADNGSVVGNYSGADGLLHPFWESLGGQPHAFSVPIPVSPEASPYVPIQAFAEGINSAGLIVGDFTDGLRTHGFLYDAKTGVSQELDVPGALATYIKGINTSGEIAGYFETSTGEHGFVAEVTPHAPTLGTFMGDSTPHVLPLLPTAS